MTEEHKHNPKICSLLNVFALKYLSETTHLSKVWIPQPLECGRLYHFTGLYVGFEVEIPNGEPQPISELLLLLEVRLERNSPA